ncbi:DDE superendonuclease family protein [Legionella anisa]|nr:preprotein translocase SecY [Legionella anisa]
MDWGLIRQLSEEEFRRLTGVKKHTFDKMVGILKSARKEKLSKGGRGPKLKIEVVLLMTLEYLREYRTYFHISKSYRISESYAYKLIRWTEDTLIKSKLFSLPGRKALVKSDVEYEVILIDATETPIERPKKTKALLFREKEKAYAKNTTDSR